MTESQTVKTRILIISDTHSTPLQPTTSPNPFRQPLPSADILIHCGDLTMKGLTSEYHKTLDLLASIDAPIKMVIAGNHDRTLDKTWMEKHEDYLCDGETYEEAREFWFGNEGRARREGVVMLEEGVHEVPLKNGGVLTLYTSQYQPEFCDWAFPYWKHEDRYNISNILIDAKHISANPIPSFSNKQLDVICTHGPPFKRGDITPHGNVGCPHLLKAVAGAKPLIHCFGHIHEGWGAETVTWENDPALGQKWQQETIQEFKDKGWERYVKDIQTVKVDKKEVMEQRAVFLDASKTGGSEIERGEQTLMVNAAIMDAEYHPVNAAFLVDVDLPVKV